MGAPNKADAQTLRNILQHSPIFCRCSKIALLNIGGTPSHLFLKSTNEKNSVFDFLEQSLISFRCTSIRILEFGGTPLYLFFESINKNHNVFDSQSSKFSFQLFYNKYKASTVKNYASSFLRDF